MVAEAANGVEALAQVLATPPDIILLDINMPKMNGLEFASIVKKEFPNVKIAIITGYDDFEYARSALRAGVDDYIVKPIAKEDVNGLVGKLIGEIKEEREQEKWDNRKNEKKAVEELLNSLIRSDRNAQSDVQKFCKLTGWDQNQKVYFVLMCDYMSNSVIWNNADEDSLAEFAILNIAGEILETQGIGIAFTTHKGEMAMVFSCFRHDLAEALDEVQTSVLDFLDIPVDFSVSSLGTLHQLSKLAEQARIALSCSFVLSDRDVICYEDVARKNIPAAMYPEELERKILDKAFSGDCKEKLGLIDRFFDQMAEPVPDAGRCRNMLLRFFMKVENVLESLASRVDVVGSRGKIGLFDPMEQLEKFETLNEAQTG
jgi:two-component system response regulator YesN